MATTMLKVSTHPVVCQFVCPHWAMAFYAAKQWLNS